MTTALQATRTTLGEVQATLLANLAYLAGATKNRLGGSATAHMRKYVLDYAGYVCVICGDATDPSAHASSRMFPHLGHLISSEFIASECGDQGSRSGFVAGNLGCQHKGCNTDMGTGVITPDQLARPDLVPIGLPKFHKHGQTERPRS